MAANIIRGLEYCITMQEVASCAALSGSQRVFRGKAALLPPITYERAVAWRIHMAKYSIEVRHATQCSGERFLRAPQTLYLKELICLIRRVQYNVGAQGKRAHGWHGAHVWQGTVT